MVAIVCVCVCVRVCVGVTQGLRLCPGNANFKAGLAAATAEHRRVLVLDPAFIPPPDTTVRVPKF